MHFWTGHSIRRNRWLLDYSGLFPERPYGAFCLRGRKREQFLLISFHPLSLIDQSPPNRVFHFWLCYLASQRQLLESLNSSWVWLGWTWVPELPNGNTESASKGKRWADDDDNQGFDHMDCICWGYSIWEVGQMGDAWRPVEQNDSKETHKLNPIHEIFLYMGVRRPW